MANICGRKTIGQWRWKAWRVSYVVPQFPELWSTSGLKPDRSFYPSSGRVHTYTSTSPSVRVPKNMKSSTYLWQAFTQTRVPVRVRVTRKLTDTGRVCTGWVFSQPVLVYLVFMQYDPKTNVCLGRHKP